MNLFRETNNKRALVIAPHPDDETLGMGGTINKMISSGIEVSILTVAGHLPPLYKKGDYELTVEEAKKAYEILGVSKYQFLDIPSTMIGDEPTHVFNGKIFSAINEFKMIFLCI